VATVSIADVVSPVLWVMEGLATELASSFDCLFSQGDTIPFALLVCACSFVVRPLDWG